LTPGVDEKYPLGADIMRESNSSFRDDHHVRKSIRKYFSPRPKWVWWVIAIGILVLFVSGGKPAAVFIGLLFIALAGCRIYLHMKDMPSDRTIDRWRDDDIDD
jgi:hypothetical protein